MLELLKSVPFLYIIIVLVVGVPYLIKFIEWCKKTWEKREKFKQRAIEQGIKIEKEEEASEHRITFIETKVELLEQTLDKLTTIINNQQEMIKQLTASDMLDIKAWIKQQHDYWMPKKWIDSQAQDLLSQRFDIYAKEGGNSWAENLKDDLMALPTMPPIEIVPVPPSYICNTHTQN